MKPPKSCALKQHNKADRYTVPLITWICQNGHQNPSLPNLVKISGIPRQFVAAHFHDSAVKSANKWRKIQNSHEYFMCTCPWRLCTRRQTGNVTEDDANDDGLYVRVERQMSRSWPHHCQHDSLHVAVSSRPHELSLSLTHSPRLSTCTLHVPRQSLTISFDNRVDLVVSGR